MIFTVFLREIMSDIHILEESDLQQIVNIHIQAFPDSALTKTGIGLIKRYYSWLLFGPHLEAVYFGAFDKKNNLQGYCFCGKYKGDIAVFLRENWKYCFMYILKHPGGLIKVLSSKKLSQVYRLLIPLKKNKVVYSLPARRFGILSIAVHPILQNQGIGHLLLEETIMQAKVRKFTEIYLTVHKSNIKAITFYRKNGWEKIPNKNDWQGLMRLKI